MRFVAVMPFLMMPGLLAGPLPDAGSPQEVEAAFQRAIQLSKGPRSGQIFTLPNAYNYVVEADYASPESSRFGDKGVIQHRGTSHGSMWEYDTRIPLAFYGPGLVKAGFKPTEPATQQDLAATYAWLMGITPPRDSAGRVLTSAFLAPNKSPKAIVTLVLDQGGRNLFAAHPGSTPNIQRLLDAGSDFVNAKVTHLESETALGHVAIGTGAYPSKTGIPANNFFLGGKGAPTYSFTVEHDHSPVFLESPTLGDHWLRLSGNRAIVISQCYSDRAAMGMGGHGSYYQGNKKSMVVYYDEKSGHYTTNGDYYSMPDYLKGLDSRGYWERLTNGSGKWLDHDIANPSTVRRTPAYVTMDGDAFVSMLQKEPVGADDVTDLLYLTLKSTDAAGHRYGFESQEADEVLKETDRQIGRIVAELDKKVGRGNYLVAITADHGGTPLVELTGGSRLIDEDLVKAINAAFPVKGRDLPVALFATGGQVWLDDQALAAAGKSRADVVAFLKAFQVNGKPFYRLVQDR